MTLPFPADRRALVRERLDRLTDRRSGANADLAHRVLTDSVKLMTAQSGIAGLLWRVDHLFTGATEDREGWRAGSAGELEAPEAVGDSPTGSRSTRRERAIERAQRVFRPRMPLLTHSLPTLRVVPIRRRHRWWISPSGVRALVAARALLIEVVAALVRVERTPDARRGGLKASEAVAVDAVGMVQAAGAARGALAAARDPETAEGLAHGCVARTTKASKCMMNMANACLTGCRGDLCEITPASGQGQGHLVARSTSHCRPW